MHVRVYVNISSYEKINKVRRYAEQLLEMTGKLSKDIRKKNNNEKNDGKDVAENFSENRIVLQTFMLITCIKCVLIPTYHSTDFEVHRNWLAITHNLPLKEWYVDARSPWTLDYPPLFAWFEYFLSRFAAFVEPEMLRIDNFNHASHGAVLFQRSTVMISDLVLVYGVKELGKVFCKSGNSFVIFAILSLCNVGLLVVDHIHFQYNGFLLGMLLISMAKVSDKTDRGRMLLGAACFAILLNLKHIYLYVAPAYIVWLLRTYCLRPNSNFFRRFIELGAVVLTVTALSFGPFVAQLPQVISRLFPFKRGLVHAYWAANAWALYVGADKALSVVLKRLGWRFDTRVASMTGGLVQEDSFAVLPTPTPLATFLLTFVSMLPALWCLLRKKSSLNPRDFVRCVVICGISSFMFGWHVHEKAILTAIVPLSVLAAVDSKDAKVFIILSSAGHTALMPLLHPSNLTPLKILLSLIYMSVTGLILASHLKKQILTNLERLYVVTLPMLTIYETIVHKLAFGEKLPFLPLALTSMYCALGIVYSWLIYYRSFLEQSDGKIVLDGDDKKK